MIEFPQIVYILFTFRRPDRSARPTKAASSRALVVSMKLFGASPENMSKSANNTSTKR